MSNAHHRATRPSAHISVNKNRLSHSNDNVVYMKHGTEFEIELFNPLQTEILAKFDFNGRISGDTGLIIKPGQRFFLERFLNDNKKFLFDVYDVDNNETVRKAVEKNGLVKVGFYREMYPTFATTTSTITYWHNNPNITWTYWPSNTTIVPSGTYTTSDSSVSVGSFCHDSSTTSTNINASIKRQLLTDSPSKADNTFETGRVEQGNTSDQHFRHVNKQFSNTASWITKIKILPVSHRTSSDMKVYCSGCGRRFRKSENFCPKCGNRK